MRDARPACAHAHYPGLTRAGIPRELAGMHTNRLIAILALVCAAPAFGGELSFTKHVVDAEFGARGADIGDRDSKGMADIVASAGNHVYWYRGGKRHLIAQVTGPANCIHLRTADIDRDGDIDVIVADHRNAIRYYENPGDGAAKQQPWPHRFVDRNCVGAHAVALADINGDGRMDIVASGEATAKPANSVFWYACPENPNTNKPWPKHVLGPGQGGGLAHYPAIGDLDMDGKPDVAHAAKFNEGGEWYRIWTQPADAAKPWKFKEIGRGYTQATNTQIGDIDGDGRNDIMATQGHHVGVLWFKAPDWRPTYIDHDLKQPHTLVLADLDRDGDLDGATCAYESKALVWFENDGKGRFTRRLISDDQCAYDLAARDVDGDGDLDLVVAGQNSNNVVWYEQVSK